MEIIQSKHIHSVRVTKNNANILWTFGIFMNLMREDIQELQLTNKLNLYKKIHTIEMSKASLIPRMILIEVKYGF